jgi:anti-sigma B factor antagonist
MPGDGYSVEWVNGLPVVVTPHEIDITNSERLAQELRSVSHRYSRTIVVDMSRTTFCGCAGLDELLHAQQEVAYRGVELRLVVATPAVRRICAIVGVDSVIPMYSSVAAAVASGPALAVLDGSHAPPVSRDEQPRVPRLG